MTRARQFAAMVGRAEGRNLVMNPLLLVNQRARTVTTAYTGDAGYTADRWRLSANIGHGTFEALDEAATSPSQYGSKYLRLLANTVKASFTANELSAISQTIEGYRIAKLGWGTAGAKPVTLSFRASASVPGVYSVSLRNAAANLSYVIPVSLTDTPQTFTFVVPGPTTGAWDTAEGIGIDLWFCGFSGTTYQTATSSTWVAGNFIQHSTQTNLFATLSAKLRIADVQLEEGRVATPLERVDYSTELQTSMRYYEAGAIGGRGYASGANAGYIPALASYCAPKRVVPTVVLTGTGSSGGGAAQVNINNVKHLGAMAIWTGAVADAWFTCTYASYADF